MDHMSAETDGVRRRRFSWGLRVALDHMSAKADGVRRRKVSFVFRLFVGPRCGVRRNVSEPDQAGKGCLLTPPQGPKPHGSRNCVIHGCTM